MKTSFTPYFLRRAIRISIIALSPTGTRGFGITIVYGFSRVPFLRPGLLLSFEISIYCKVLVYKIAYIPVREPVDALFQPIFSEYPGDQSRSLFALVLSAHRRSTSLFSGLIRPDSCSISMVVPISKAIFPARSPIEISELLPRLITSPAEVSASAALINPFAVSLTKLRSLVGVNECQVKFSFFRQESG